MADFDASLPVRTQTKGDVAVLVVDENNPAQSLAIDAQGKVSTKLNDGLGVEITSTLLGAKQALDVSLKDENGDLLGTAMYPLATAVSPNGIGDGVHQREVEANVAALASGVNTYTVPAGKVAFYKEVKATASGKCKVQVEYSADGVTFIPLFDAFNSTATPNIALPAEAELMIPAGGQIKVTLTNRDLLAQDLYSTISVVEVAV